MTGAVQNPPQGYHTLTPYMTVRDARTALDFYAKAFGAEKVLLLHMPDGSVAHAEIRIGDSVVMLAEENEAWGNKSPLALGGSPPADVEHDGRDQECRQDGHGERGG